MNDLSNSAHIAAGSEAREPADASGDFEAFFRAERGGLLGSLLLMSGNTFDAEEILQEAFFKVWERWDRVSGMANPAGYLYRTAMNAQRSAYRRTVRAAKRVLTRPTEEDPFVAVAAWDDMLRALAAMTPRQRAAIVLIELRGYDVDEAAETLGIRPGTVRVLVSKARATIRKMERIDE